MLFKSYKKPAINHVENIYCFLVNIIFLLLFKVLN